MTKRILKKAIFALGTALALGEFPDLSHAQAPNPVLQEWEGDVIQVVDGDTILIIPVDRTQTQLIHLDAIDAPEEGQSYSARSKTILETLVLGKRVKIVPQRLDAAGNVIARIYRGNTDVCAEHVKKGMAWVDPHNNKDSSLSQAERQAKAGDKGLWHEQYPIPPWSFRAGFGSAGTLYRENQHQKKPPENPPASKAAASPGETPHASK